MKPKRITVSFSVESPVKKALIAFSYYKKTKPSELIRQILIDELKKNEFLPEMYQSSIVSGGDHFTGRVAAATPEEAEKIRQTYRDLAARARAIRSAKSKNSKITISGDSSVPISQKNL